MKIKYFTLVICVIAFITLGSQESSAQYQNQCVSLSTDLAYGDNDYSTNGSVTILQRFLVNKGYLSATPNGNYGPATVAAVKSFQAAYKISQTGTAGPLTRSTIQSVSCSYSYQSPAPSPSYNPTPSLSIIPQAIQVTSPMRDDILLEGTTYNISWNNGISGNYNILLEDQYGIGAGYIASSRAGGTSYSWDVGTVYSAANQSDILVKPGIYRIRIQSVSGSSKNDMISGLFKVEAAPLYLKSLMPTTLPNDNKSSAVVYGSGFDSSTRLTFDSDYGPRAAILYRSPDGKILVFSVPNNISPGSHIITLSNQNTITDANIALTVTAAK